MDVVGVVGRAEVVEGGLVMEDVGVGVLDALVLGVVGPAVVGVDVVLDAAVSPPSCEMVHSTGF